MKEMRKPNHLHCGEVREEREVGRGYNGDVVGEEIPKNRHETT
jgi:hypothetical protein